MSTADQIRATVASPLESMDLVVEDISVTRAGKRSVVRILVDSSLASLDPTDVSSPVAPLSLDTIADATRLVGDALDADDSLGDAPYTLEVSSPGVGRPLTTPDHFRRQVGRLVEVTPTEGAPLTGRIMAVTATDLTLELPATKKAPAQSRELALDGISRGVVQVEFRRVDEVDGASDDSAEPETSDDHDPQDHADAATLQKEN